MSKPHQTITIVLPHKKKNFKTGNVIQIKQPGVRFFHCCNDIRNNDGWWILEGNQVQKENKMAFM